MSSDVDFTSSDHDADIDGDEPPVSLADRIDHVFARVVSREPQRRRVPGKFQRMLAESAVPVGEPIATSLVYDPDCRAPQYYKDRCEAVSEVPILDCDDKICIFGYRCL